MDNTPQQAPDFEKLSTERLRWEHQQLQRTRDQQIRELQQAQRDYSYWSDTSGMTYQEILNLRANTNYFANHKARIAESQRQLGESEYSIAAIERVLRSRPW